MAGQGGKSASAMPLPAHQHGRRALVALLLALARSLALARLDALALLLGLGHLVKKAHELLQVLARQLACAAGRQATSRAQASRRWAASATA